MKTNSGFAIIVNRQKQRKEISIRTLNPVVCIADFEDMQKAYGTDFCVLGGAFDGEVCSRQAAIELHQISATRYS